MLFHGRLYDIRGNIEKFFVKTAFNGIGVFYQIGYLVQQLFVVNSCAIGCHELRYLCPQCLTTLGHINNDTFLFK